MKDSRSRQAKGRRGEELAASCLQARGYQVVARNYHCRVGEIDIVAQKDGELYFVEVRSRSGDVFGDARETLGVAKRRKLALAINSYLQTIDFQGECHFLLAAVDLQSGFIELIEDYLI